MPLVQVHNPAGGVLNIPKFWEDYGLFQKTFSDFCNGPKLEVKNTVVFAKSRHMRDDRSK